MEAVRAFNNELSSLYETRPPISRAKMANVTKCGIKAIKFYKHVVQSVEKFIQKCKPEYKVPGLYVIDSIVRQSRHQFNTEKDVFAPRFTKNIVSTFQNLFKCPQEEKSKVVRVLNLWQKNGVFPMEVVQPLLDLAADPNNVELVLTAQRAVERVVSAHAKTHGSASQTSSGADKSRVDNSKAADNIMATQNDMLATVTKLLQQTDDQGITSLSAQQQQLQQLQILQQQLMQQTELMQKPQESGPVIDSNLLAQIQTLTNQLLSKTGGSVSDNPPSEPGFNKKLLDFDYGESDDEEDKKDGSQQMQGFPMSNVQNILNDPNLMHHIHQMSQTMQKNEVSVQEQLRQQVLQQQQEEFDKEIKQGPPPGFVPIGMQRLDAMQQQQQQQMQQQYHNYDHPQPAPDSSVDVEVIDDHDDDREDRHRSHRDRSRSRSPRKRRRSRSRSRDRRRRSRSRDRHRRSRSRDRDREKTKEKERDRRKKGLPPVREKQLSVCTTTLWLGHLTKHTTEEDIRAEIEKYGTVNSVNLIPPRGCAYIDYVRRKDAYKARDKLDRGIRINGNILKVSWAQGIGVKNPEYKDLWNVDHGVTYIPWGKLPADLNLLCGGGIVDEDTLPDHLKGLKFGGTDEESREAAPQADQNSVSLPMGGQPQYAGPLPGVVPVIPPHLGVMPPMMMPMPGQMPGPMPPGMPPQHIRMPPGPPPGMPPQMAGMPGMPGAPPSSQPVPLSTVLGVSSAISSAPLTMSAASAQLSQAIQSILSTSIPSGQQPAPPPAAAATIVAQPAMPPQARFQGFNPGFNPNMPPPPNIRLPVVGGPGMMPAGLRPQFIPTSSTSSVTPHSSTVTDTDTENEDENMDIQDTDERSLPTQEIQSAAPVPPGQPPGFAVSRPVGPMHLQPGGPMLRGQVPRPMLVGQQHGIGIQMRPMMQMNMGERPRMMIAGEFRPSGPQAVIGAVSGNPRQQGPGPLMHTADGPRPFMVGPRGAPGINRPGLLGMRPGFQRFGPPQGPPGAPPNFRGPRPPFRPNGPPVENPFMNESAGPNFGRVDADIDDRDRFSGPRPLMEIETEPWNPSDQDNPPPPNNFGRRDFERMDEDFDEMGNAPYRFGSGRGRSRDFGRDRDRDFRRDGERGDKDRERGFGRDAGFRDGSRYDRSPRSDRSFDRERDRDRDHDRDRDRDRDRGHDRRSRQDGSRDRDRDKDKAKESDSVQEPKTKVRDRSGRQSRWSDVPAVTELESKDKSAVESTEKSIADSTDKLTTDSTDKITADSEEKSTADSQAARNTNTDPQTLPVSVSVSEPVSAESIPPAPNEDADIQPSCERPAVAENKSPLRNYSNNNNNNISSTEGGSSKENTSLPINDCSTESLVNNDANGSAAPSAASSKATSSQHTDSSNSNLPVASEASGPNVKSVSECGESFGARPSLESDTNAVTPGTSETNGPEVVAPQVVTQSAGSESNTAGLPAEQENTSDQCVDSEPVVQS